MRAEALNIRTASDDSCGGGLGTRLGGATKDGILGGPQAPPRGRGLGTKLSSQWAPITLDTWKEE